MTGKFNYYDDTRSNNPTSIMYPQNNTNAKGAELHGYVMVKYSIVKTDQFNLMDSSFTDLEFSVSVEAYYLFNKRVGVGIKVGGYIEPDFPMVGAHIGPQIRVRL